MSKHKKHKGKIKKGRLMIVILPVVLIAVVCVLLFAPVFNVSSIVVEGNAKVKKEEILEQVSLVKGTNIFRINSSAMQESLSALAYLDTIEIRKEFPSQLRVCVTESNAALVFPHATGYLLTTEEGKVLEVFSDEKQHSFPHILGADIKKAEISEKISVQDEVKFDIILNCIRYFKENGQLELMQSIDFSDITNISAIYQEGYRVNFAKFDDNMEYKLKMLERILPELDRSPGTYIDLSTPSKVFTGREEPTPTPIVSPKPTESAEPAAASASASAAPAVSEVPAASAKPTATPAESAKPSAAAEKQEVSEKKEDTEARGSTTPRQ